MRSAFVTSSISRDAGGLFFAMTSLARSLHGLGVDVAVEGVLDTHSPQTVTPRSHFIPSFLSSHES